MFLSTCVQGLCETTVTISSTLNLCHQLCYTYRKAKKFRRVKFTWKLIWLSFRDFIFADQYHDVICMRNFCGLKFSWAGTNPWKPQNFYPAKLSSYTVHTSLGFVVLRRGYVDSKHRSQLTGFFSQLGYFLLLSRFLSSRVEHLNSLRHIHSLWQQQDISLVVLYHQPSRSFPHLPLTIC